VYAGLLEPWGEGHQQQWGLYEKRDAAWTRVYTSPRSKLLNQPPVLLVDDQGSVHAFAWLDGVCHHLLCIPADGTHTEEAIDVGYDDMWPYAGGSASDDGELLVVPSSYPAHMYGFLATGSDAWVRGTAVSFAERTDTPSNYDRHCYPFVVLNGREAHIFSTQDINDAEKIAAGEDFTYSFRTLDYYYSSDLLSTAFEAVSIVDVEASKGWAHNDDLLLDWSGQVHILYRYQAIENVSRNSPLMHAFGPPGGPFTHVAVTPEEDASEGRLWEARNGVLYVVRVGQDGLEALKLGGDGSATGNAMSLGVHPYADDYTSSRVFLVAERACRAPFLEGLFQMRGSGGQTAIHYFRATHPELVADVNGDGAVGFADFLALAASYGSSRGDVGYEGAADVDADGTVGFADFLGFVDAYRRLP